MTTVEELGSLPGGRSVSLYHLGTGADVRLAVLDLGCTVHQLWVPDGEGRRTNVVLGCRDVDGYVRRSTEYYGAVVGRFANRIAGAEVTIDGTSYALAANDGVHSLHGGPEGFHTRVWDVVAIDDSSITLSLVSPDGDQGFPGELRTEVTYRVEERRVHIRYRAEADAPTVVNLTQHAHFNLRGEGSGSVEDHLLQVSASRYTPVTSDLIPTGELAAVDGTSLDLRSSRRIGDLLRVEEEQLRRARGIDHNFVLDAAAPVAAALTDPVSGLRLEVSTHEPGLQVYTGNFFDGSHVGTSGRAYRQGDGVALETQRFPDSPHHDGEPGWPSVVLRPGQVYETWTTWDFPLASRLG